MLSYMSLERIEGDYAVCEVEQIPTTDARTDDFCCISCFRVDIPISTFHNMGIPVEVGGIYTVYHNGESVDEIHSIDHAEKARRIRIIDALAYT